MSFLKPGLLGRAELIVGEEHTAKSVGSGMIGVLATPVMINLIEAAALQAIEAHLPERCQSLGTHLEVSHGYIGRQRVGKGDPRRAVAAVDRAVE